MIDFRLLWFLPAVIVLNLVYASGVDWKSKLLIIVALVTLFFGIKSYL